MEKIVSSAASENAFQGLGAAIKGAEASKMFGMPCFKTKGKAFMGLFNDDLVFKLTGDSHAEALALKGSKLFDPSGMNRPMKEWVQVTKAHKAKWPRFATDSFKYVTKNAK